MIMEVSKSHNLPFANWRNREVGNVATSEALRPLWNQE